MTIPTDASLSVLIYITVETWGGVLEAVHLLTLAKTEEDSFSGSSYVWGPQISDISSVDQKIFGMVSIPPLNAFVGIGYAGTLALGVGG